MDNRTTIGNEQSRYNKQDVLSQRKHKPKRTKERTKEKETYTSGKGASNTKQTVVAGGAVKVTRKPAEAKSRKQVNQSK